jgi:sulfotransferase
VIEKTFYFMAGMPRSGSTLLMSILNQNPMIYGTPTSPLLDLLYLNEQAWRKCPSVIANPIGCQLESISESIINGCWEHVPQTIIIDKHRAWGRNISAIEKIFHKPPKVIVTVRDVPSVLASFMRLLRESNQSPNYIDQILIKRGMSLTDANRVDVLWKDFVYDPWDSLKTAFTNNRSSLLLVDYDDLIISKDEVVDRVYRFLDMPAFQHDFNNIQNNTEDDDLMAWGLENLHAIRPTLGKTSKHPRDVLGEDIFVKYSNMNLEFWK